MKHFYILLICFLPFTISAQEMQGMLHSNYAGVNSLMENPARIADSRYWLDINIVTSDVFLSNNYFYIPHKQYGFGGPYRRITNDAESIDIETKYETERWLKLYGGERINILSGMYNYGPHGFAITPSVRTLASARGIENNTLEDFIDDSINGTPAGAIAQIKNARISGLSWAEIGFTYAYSFSKYKDNKWSVGATARYIFGFGGVGFDAKTIQYRKENDTLHLYNYNFDMGGITPFGDDGGFINGHGYGIDIGVVYQKKKDGNGYTHRGPPCAQKFDPYLYRIGISILDIGRVNINKSTRQFHIEGDYGYFPGFDSWNPQSIDEMSSTAAAQYASEPSPVSDNIKVGLPLAVSFQFDYNPFGNWFYNFTYIQGGFSPLKYNIYRPTMISFTPRYEKSWIEVDFPLSLYDWYSYRVGIAFRILYLTIGTDFFNSFTGLSNYTGTDFYFALKFNLDKGNCSTGPSLFFKGKRYYDNACPD